MEEELTTASVPPPTNLSTYSEYPMQLDDLPHVVLVNGIVSPILVGVTLLTNICVCVVLVRPNMRSATNTLLVAMAVSDTLTGLCPLPAYFRFYSGGDGAHREWLPYSWCAAFYSLTDHLPTIFHTASVWLTVALAAQRYVYVCRAVDARRWCTIDNSLRAVAVIYVVAVLYQICRFAEMRYTAVQLPSLIDGTGNETVVGCIGEYWPVLLRLLQRCRCSLGGSTAFLTASENSHFVIQRSVLSTARSNSDNDNDNTN